MVGFWVTRNRRRAGWATEEERQRGPRHPGEIRKDDLHGSRASQNSAKSPARRAGAEIFREILVGDELFGRESGVVPSQFSLLVK